MTTTAATPVLTPQMRAEIEAFFSHYPTRQAVTLPALHVVNDHLRCVPLAAIPEIAEMLNLSPAEVNDTMTFYGFFKQHPCGLVRAWVCRSISCALRGGEEVLAELSKRLGVAPGGTTPDGKITLEFGECLGQCDFAPAMLANEQVYKNMSVEQVGDVAGRLIQQAQS